MKKAIKKNIISTRLEKSKIFITPAWQQHTDTIEQLCQSSQNIVLVVAPQQGGKTTFAKHLLRTSTPELRKKAIRARPQSSVEELMHQIAKSYELAWQGTDMILSQIKNHVDQVFSEKQITSVLLIDDAHLLSVEQLQALIALVQFEADPWRQLHLILLGEPSLEFRLFSPEFSSFVHGKVHTVELDAWTLVDIKNFFAKDATLPNAAEQMAGILERSRGLPGFVIQEGELVFGQLTVMDKKMTKRNFKSWFTRSISVGVSAGVLIGGGYLLFNHNMEEERNNIPINEAQLAEDAWPVDDVIPKKEEATNATDTTELPIAFHFENTENSNTANSAVEEEPPLVAENNVPAPAPEVEKIQEPLAASHMHIEMKEPPVQAEVKEAIKPQLKSKIIAKKPTKKSLNSAEEQLLSANGHHYTVQLLGLGKEAKVKQFIQAHGLNDKAHYFRTQRSGKDWFVVVYGDYPTAKHAKLAMHEMPVSLKRENLQPWVRELHAVQDDIKKYRQS